MFEWWRRFDLMTIEFLETFCASWSIVPYHAARICAFIAYGIWTHQDFLSGRYWMCAFGLFIFGLVIVRVAQMEQTIKDARFCNPYKVHPQAIMMRQLMACIMVACVPAGWTTNVPIACMQIFWWLLACNQLPQDPWWKRIGQKKLATQAT